MQQDGPLDVTGVGVRTQPPAPVVSAEVVRRAITRDAAAFAELYEADVARVFRQVRYRVTDPDIAEDITSQVFLRAWQAIDRYKPLEGRPFLAWLFSIANNLVIDHHRRAQRTTPGIALERRRSNDPDPEEEAINSDLHGELRAAIARLKPDFQMVVSLRLIEDMEYEDIALVMEKKPGALRVMLFRALAALRADLEQRGLRP